jgi:hypothetical protein
VRPNIERMNTLVLDIKIKIAITLFNENPFINEDMKCDVCFKIWLIDDEFRKWFNDGGHDYIADEATVIINNFYDEHHHKIIYCLLGYRHRNHIDDLPTIICNKDTSFGSLSCKDCAIRPNEKRKWMKRDNYHRDNDLPAKIYPYRMEWYKNNQLDRDGDKPAIMRTDDLSEEYFTEGTWNRGGDKPAIILKNKMKWAINGYVHRENDKPAVVYHNGTQKWLKYGRLHRGGDRPAIIRADGSMEWWVNGNLIIFIIVPI